MNEDVNARIQGELRWSMETMKWRRELIESGKPITEWPPGWVVVENTDEDASR